MRDDLSLRVLAGARNALELARLGRLGEDYAAPYQVVDQGSHHRLRRYANAGDSSEVAGVQPRPVALLVPPLMLTAEIYDVAADVSAVAALGARGIIPFVVDFGSPEHIQGGLRRTLDDHVRAVLQSIERVRALTGQAVHLLGYSQGGMFCYQAAAYLRCEGIGSVVTFGSPVDIHRNLPAVRADIVGAMARSLLPAVNAILERIEGLPGAITSTGFKLLSTRKELEQRLEFLSLLHDREALVRREARRRFLGGAGFVAWPGPAFRAFVNDFIVHNRMLSGGFVIEGRTVTLADLTCPILAFVGTTDEIARPATVEAISDAAPLARVEIASVPAGHFGIVVGSRAMRITWPTVAEHIHRLEPGATPRPEAPLPAAPAARPDPEEPEASGDLRLALDTALSAGRDAWRRLGDVTRRAYDAYDTIRYREPRLRRLASLSPDDRVSPSKVLAERARRTPESVFFLWQDRAFTYQQADARVSAVTRGFCSLGIRRGDRVAVVMRSRPSFLSAQTALGRLGAVPVLVPPDTAAGSLATTIAELGVRGVVTDPELAVAVQEALGGRQVWVLGGGSGRALAPGLLDMEAIDPDRVQMPPGVELDAGRARDLAMILLRPAAGSGGAALRAVPVTNHRWALSAYGAAAACSLKPADTVYCAVPLHHPTGVLASAGSALAGGARLALVETFDPAQFTALLRRYGATVVFYAGEMLRAVVNLPPQRGDRHLAVRLFAGSGVRVDLAARLRERFGASVLEFYASTAQRVILAEASGLHPGALGRVLPGSTEVRLVAWDPVTGQPRRGEDGFWRQVPVDQPGLLVSRADPGSGADPVAGHGGGGEPVRDAFASGDAWHVSGDILRRDAGGDHWFVDARSGFVSTPAGPVSTRRVEDALYALAEVDLAAAWSEGGQLMAAVVAKQPLEAARLQEALARLAPHERPLRIVQPSGLPLTDGHRPLKPTLAELSGPVVYP